MELETKVRNFLRKSGHPPQNLQDCGMPATNCQVIILLKPK